MRRRAYIKKAPVNETGYSFSCPGCRAAEAGVAGGNDAGDCCAWIENKLEESEKETEMLQRGAL